MKKIPDGSIDMILCDLPYGTTNCSWDTVIPFEPLWKEYKRIVKKNGAVVLFGSQPFTSALVMSNVGWFDCSLVWEKNKATGHLNANKKHLRSHEDIIVFAYGSPMYNPLMKKGIAYSNSHKPKDSGDCYGSVGFSERENIETRYPRSVLQFDVENDPSHPTQKPVPLCEYLILTYTNGGEIVLDNTMGSGTTGVACIHTGRKFMGIELDPHYFQIAKKRIESAQLPLGF